jgi:hypothetical protein
MRPMTLRPADRVSQSQALFQNLRTERSKSNFKIHNSLSQYRETKVAHKTPRRLQLAGKVPNGVRFGKTCCAATAESAACRIILLCSLPSSFLELAKGFEPPTL